MVGTDLVGELPESVTLAAGTVAPGGHLHLAHVAVKVVRVGMEGGHELTERPEGERQGPV